MHRLADQMDGLLLIVPGMGPSETRALPARRVLWKRPVDITGVPPEEVASFEDMAVVQTQGTLKRGSGT